MACPGCGHPADEGDRYRSSCGRVLGAEVVVDLDAAAARTPKGADGATRSRTLRRLPPGLAGLGMALLLAVVGVALFAGGGAGDDEADSPRPSTPLPRADATPTPPSGRYTTTPRPTPPPRATFTPRPTATPTPTPGPIDAIPEADAVTLVVTDGRALMLVDLGSGERRTMPGLSVEYGHRLGSPFCVRVDGGTVACLDPQDPTKVVETSAGGDDFVPSANGIWLVAWRQTLEVRFLAFDGGSSEQVVLPNNAVYPIGSWGDELVIQALGGVYAIDISGSIHRLAEGQLVGSTGGAFSAALGVIRCDPSLACAIHVVDIESGDDIGVVALPDYYDSATVSPDGTTVAIAVGSGFSLVDVATGVRTDMKPESAPLGYAPLWSPDSRWLVAGTGLPDPWLLDTSTMTVHELDLGPDVRVLAVLGPV